MLTSGESIQERIQRAIERSNAQGRVSEQLKDVRIAKRFRDEQFLAKIGRLVAEKNRSPRKRDQVLALYKDAAAHAKELRYAQKTLATLETNAVAVHKRVRVWIAEDGCLSLEIAIKKLEEARLAVRNAEQSAVETLPSKRVRAHYAVSRWESLIDGVDHSWSRIRNKETEHRLWRQIDNQLKKYLPRDVLSLTRHTITSILLSALSDGWVEPTTIKQHFYQYRAGLRK